MTPLQMLIAEKIININKDENFDLILIAPNNNEKYKFYYARLESLCSRSLYYTEEHGLKGFINFIKCIKKESFLKGYSRIYLCNIDRRYQQYIVSKNKYSKIYTFDDGIGNIIPDSVYYENTRPQIHKRLIWRLIGINKYTSEIRNSSLLHYTIYENIPNIIKNTYFIKLFDANITTNTETKKTVRIFIGQPLNEFSELHTQGYLNKVIEIIDIDYYYPHPRETVLPKGNFKVLNSHLIFEEYIVQYLIENPFNSVEVYSFNSSCLLNIAQLDRVKLTYICDDYLENKLKDFYELAIKHMNIHTHKIKSI